VAETGDLGAAVDPIICGFLADHNPDIHLNAP
jgi:hypothetical protein